MNSTSTAKGKILSTSVHVCLQMHRCGAGNPVWLDLEGGALPVPGEEKDVRACASTTNTPQSYKSCCNSESTVIVKNCGDFFVYKIIGVPDGECDVAYCAKQD